MAGVNEILSSITKLPSLPGSAARVIAALTSESCTIDELEQLVKYDEAIAVMVLRHANSARFGVPGRVFSLRESLSRLGSRAVLQIALEQQMSGLLDNAGSAYGLRRGELWRGALGGAIAAEEIGQRVQFQDPDLAFLGALLRDIGKLAFDQLHRTDEITRASESSAEDQSFLECERIALGVDHAELGSALASNWGLPDRLAMAIRFHHSPPPPDSPDHDLLFDVIHAADVICLWTGLATGVDGLQYPLAPHVRESLLCKREIAESCITTMWSRLSEIEREFGASEAQEQSA